MTALDRLIPAPHLLEINRARIPAPAALVWDAIRHGELAQLKVARALFWLRNLFAKHSDTESPTIRIDDLRSSRERPGFQMLAEEPPREFAVGAIGQVWRLRIPFVHVENADEYAAFAARGFIKVAWAIRVAADPEGGCSLVEIEVRVRATDETSWRKFRWYYRLIGPFSRYMRRSLLRSLGRGAFYLDHRPPSAAHHAVGRG
jgi:hypothetical protein